MTNGVLKPTKQRRSKRRFFGIDIETYDNNTKISMISVWSESFQKTYRYPYEFIHDLKTLKIFQNCFFVATNLSFDFFGIFWKRSEMNCFWTIPKGNTSNLIYAKVHVFDGQFVKESMIEPGKKRSYSITFIDTANFSLESVESLGSLMQLPKLKKPNCVEQQCFPRSDEEWNELVIYNMRDAEISCRFMIAMRLAFESLGATFKITIASTSMSLFTNKYLKIPLFRCREFELMDMFESYIGGRTEVFGRGSLRVLMRRYNVNRLFYVDINSLYPSVMRDFKYPNPNTRRYTRKNTTEYIMNYEGVSQVTVQAPEGLKVPLLPFRREDKIIFPLGTFTGRYTHIELRRAIELGYHILDVKSTYYFLETMEPFREFVDDLYGLRQRYKSEGNKIMELVVKLIMNSLYGKFGQRFYDKQSVVPLPDTVEELQSYGAFDIVKQDGMEFVRLKHQRMEPAAFCIPIWATYITSYARLRLYSYLEKYRIVYCDTDSAISIDEIPTSKKLGDMKFEGFVEDGYIVRSKFYGMKGCDDKGESFDTVKIKGVTISKKSSRSMKTLLMNVESMREYLSFRNTDGTTRVLRYGKLVKWKESLARSLNVNTLIEITKQLKFEDDKHRWEKPFDVHEWQDAQPIILNGESFFSKQVKT